MTSKEALELAILEYEKETIDDENNQWVKNVLKGLKEVKQDLDRLEQLEDNIKIHKETIKMQHSQIESLQSENKKLNKQLDVFFDKLDNNTLRAFDLISYELKDENEKLKKVIEILEGRICVNQDCICYDMCADKPLTDEEIKLVKEYFGNDK